MRENILTFFTSILLFSDTVFMTGYSFEYPQKNFCKERTMFFQIYMVFIGTMSLLMAIASYFKK